MKKSLSLLSLVLLVSVCTPKKTETTSVADSLSVDSAVRATQPAPSALAFGEVSGFLPNNKTNFTDSINFLLFTSQEELDKAFDLDKKSANEKSNPDFIINYVVGIACKPTQNLTTITMDKAEVVDNEIHVYLHIQYGEKQQSVARPSQIFAIERRGDIIDIQFWVNGKKSQALMLI